MIARLAVVTVALVGFAGCSEDTVTAQDAYKIGCPAVDTAVAGGGLAAKAAVAGLKKLSESGQLDPEPQKWLDATISLLEADGDPARSPPRRSSSSSPAARTTAMSSRT